MKEKENTAVWEGSKDGVPQELTENREERAFVFMGWRPCTWALSRRVVRMGRRDCQGSKRKVQRSRLVGPGRVPRVRPEATLNGVFITDHPAFTQVETTEPSISKLPAGESWLHLPLCRARLTGVIPSSATGLVLSHCPVQTPPHNFPGYL